MDSALQGFLVRILLPSLVLPFSAAISKQADVPPSLALRLTSRHLAIKFLSHLLDPFIRRDDFGSIFGKPTIGEEP